MLLRRQVNLSINHTPTAIWDFAHDPKNWTASDPKKHVGSKFNSPKQPA